MKKAIEFKTITLTHYECKKNKTYFIEKNSAELFSYDKEKRIFNKICTLVPNLADFFNLSTNQLFSAWDLLFVPKNSLSSKLHPQSSTHIENTIIAKGAVHISPSELKVLLAFVCHTVG